MRTIKLSKRSHYGTEYVYPACPESEMLVKLTGHKTFSPRVLEILRDSGYTFEYVAEREGA